MGANEPQRKRNGHVQRDNNLDQGGGLYILLWNGEKQSEIDCYYAMVEWISVLIRGKNKKWIWIFGIIIQSNYVKFVFKYFSIEIFLFGYIFLFADI